MVCIAKAFFVQTTQCWYLKLDLFCRAVKFVLGLTMFALTHLLLGSQVPNLVDFAKGKLEKIRNILTRNRKKQFFGRSLRVQEGNRYYWKTNQSSPSKQTVRWLILLYSNFRCSLRVSCLPSLSLRVYYALKSYFSPRFEITTLRSCPVRARDEGTAKPRLRSPFLESPKLFSRGFAAPSLARSDRKKKTPATQAKSLLAVYRNEWLMLEFLLWWFVWLSVDRVQHPRTDLLLAVL